jgi:hypothetical protein
VSTDRPDAAGEDDDLGFEIPDDLSGLEALLASDAPAPVEGHGGPGGDAATDGPSTDGTGSAPGAPGTAAPTAADPTTAAPDPAAPAPAEPEDEPVLAVLVTQVAGARPLAAACALAGIDADTVASPVGALAVLRDTTAAATTAAAAGDLSRVLRLSPVILLDRRGGRIAATRWLGGAQEDELAPGLVLSGAPEVLEDLLIGGTPVQDLPGVQTSVGMSRWAAMRALAGRKGSKG